MSANEYTAITPIPFNLELSLDCGQAFRWEKNAEGFMCGVIGKKLFRLRQDGDKLICNCTADEYNNILLPYFDFGRDYNPLIQNFSDDENLKSAISEFPGIRILRQEPWETLCSFIISQNNNIPRIKGIVERLCENFGEEIEEKTYSFPSAEKLACVPVDELAIIRSGFRAKYILDAAKKVSDKEVCFEKIDKNNTDFGRTELIKIKGVGKKVAECTLLYGFAKTDAFPEDVWVKRIVAEMYPDGLPECISGYEGIAQQYLFHWRRNSERFSVR